MLVAKYKVLLGEREREREREKRGGVGIFHA